MKGILGFLVIGFVLYLLRKKGKDAISDSSVSNATGANADGEADLTTIINKVGRTFMNQKYDQGLELINANIGRFEGEHKAQLLNQRAGLYTIKGDHSLALPDYKLAYELDPSLTNLTNYIEGLVKLDMLAEAKPLAEQAMMNPNLRSDDRKMLQGVLG